ncbi:hypothetical protein [Sediminimonas qiaohouensis]|uniref:hypothetical protein n=1 Tax=Sediminimonas qiaohouensis TaxID=552061 RepID=UPI0004100A12|nr:hypothetical protein [Sediminimonas qiaohouensis]
MSIFGKMKAGLSGIAGLDQPATRAVDKSRRHSAIQPAGRHNGTWRVWLEAGASAIR